MLLFSVHPEPEGRKVDKMLTLKKVKEMVKAPAHTKRVPSPKVLLEEGRIFLRKEFEHGSHLTLYHNGYVWFSAGKRNTVFHIHDCRGDYAYGASKGKGEVIKEEYFENCEWHIRALFEGEQRVEESQLKCEGVGQTKVSVSYHAVAEDWGEMADSEINVLDRCVCRCGPASAPEHHPLCGRQAASPGEYDIPDGPPNRRTGHGRGFYPAAARPLPAMLRPAPAARSSSHA